MWISTMLTIVLQGNTTKSFRNTEFLLLELIQGIEKKKGKCLISFLRHYNLDIKT
jgi:hypothetical protein